MNTTINPEKTAIPPLPPATGSAATATKITVAGVTFSADEVVSAIVKLDGREVHITRKEDEPRKMGFGR